MKNKLNKKGLSFVDVIVGLTLLSATLMIAFQFLGFLKEHKDVHNSTAIIIQMMNNESERAYRATSWAGIEGSTIVTPKGNAVSTFTEYKITEYNTEHLRLEIVLGKFSEDIVIERSVYFIE